MRSELTEADREESRQITNKLARLNTLWLAFSVATLSALGVFVATMILVIQGNPSSEHLALLSNYFPGYTVTGSGAFIGAFWAFCFGLVLPTPAAWFYYHRVIREAGRGSAPDLEEPDQALGTSLVRIHLASFSIAAGLTAGIAIFVASAMLLLHHSPGEPLGTHLSLLGQYLPGYSVSWVGSLIGFAYFSIIGGIDASLVGWIYNRLITGGRGS